MIHAIRSTYFAVCVFLLACAGPTYPGDNLVDALKAGKVDLYLRYRFELVEDGQPRIIPGTPPTLSTIPLQDAHASTLRAALGDSSGLSYDFGASGDPCDGGGYRPLQGVPGLRNELEQARTRLAERKIIERAKGTLTKQRRLD